MKIIVSGGGTGGHIYPAIAIADAVKARIPEAEILFVGAEGKMEMEKVPKAGYPIEGLPIAGINRQNWMANLGFPVKLVQSIWKAWKIVRNFRPDAVVGVGGYASGPTLWCAGRLGIPTLIQEQNSFAGKTNQWLAGKAKRICVAYPNMERFFPSDRILFTGNPVRADICKQLPEMASARRHFGLHPERPTVLVIGGSQGARSINLGVEKYLSTILSAGYQVIWQTGKSFSAPPTTEGVYVSPFIYDMAQAYAAADVVISRAGALSVSELCIVQKPAILVPFPHAAEDHQTENARALVQADAAVLIKDADVQGQLWEQLNHVLTDPALRARLSNQMKSFAKPQAAATIADEIIRL